jgi:hypothetical protein
MKEGQESSCFTCPRCGMHIMQSKQQTWSYDEAHNYEAKVFVKFKHHSMVVNIPTGKFNLEPKYSDLIGADNIFETLQYLLSHKYEGALFPIELANNISSISIYPSSHVLERLLLQE